MILSSSRFRNLHSAIRLVWEAARGWAALQAALAVIQGLLPVATLLLTRRVVDSVAQFLDAPAGMRDAGHLLALAPWVVLVTLIGWIVRALGTMAADIQAELVADRVQDTIQCKSVDVDLASFETVDYYDRMRLAQSEAGVRPQSIVRSLARLGSGAIALVSVMGVIGMAQGPLVPVLLAAACPGILAQTWSARRLKRWQIARSESQRYAHYLNMLLTALPFAKEVRLNQLGDELRARYSRLRARLRRSRLLLLRRRATANLLAQAAAAVAMVAGLGLVYLRARSGKVTLGDLALLARGFQRGKSAFGDVLGSLASLYEDSLFVDHYYKFLALPVRVSSPAHPRPMPRKIERGIRFEHVAFRYPGTDRDVLRDVDLTVRPGERVALVGENGSGKTTLVKLLCRFYDPTAGRILLDGIDLREFDLAELRAAYSGLFQDFARYYMTVGENIRMGDVRIAPGNPRIAAAAEQVGAVAMIEQLAHGYSTPLGRLFTNGVELSEGQWQRLALARAFLRPAPIVLLDEPTAALDARAERELIEAVLHTFADRTAIIVSHRLSTVRAADRILLLADGRIAESGNHDELMLANGLYANLYGSPAA